MTIEEMKKKKEEFGFSCERISELSGVPIGTVQKIFGGITRKPRYETICQLGKAFPIEYIPNRKNVYTLEEFENISKEYAVELIDGIIYKLERTDIVYQQLIFEISIRIREYIKLNEDEGMVLSAPVYVQLDKDEKTMICPAAVICCDKNKILPSHIYGAPDMIIEMALPSTRKINIGLKLQKYINAGVREYWIIDLEKKKIVVYYLEENGLPEIYDFVMKVPIKIFKGKCEIDFKEVYECIKFLDAKNNYD